MARKSIIAELKEFVEEQTKGVGVVSNLHGVIESADETTTENKRQTWFVAQVPVSSAPDLSALLRAFTYERPGFASVEATAGVVQYPSSGSIAPLSAVMFYGMINLPNPRKIDVRLRGENSTVSLYLDGVQTDSGADTVKTSMEISAGPHVLVAIVYGATKPVTLELSPDVEILSNEVNPVTPSWLQFPTAYLLEPASGNIVARMQWSNDPHASSWNIYRAPTAEWGRVVGTPTVNGDGNVSFVVPSTVTVTEGDRIFTEYFEAGQVASVTPGSPNSTIVVTPVPETDMTMANWTNIRVYSLQEFLPVASVPNAGGLAVTWHDSTITINKFYAYKITSLGPFGLSESSYSSTQGLFANDEDCPAGIDWDVAHAPTITIEGYQATVRFPTPTDPDFAGIRVYGPYALVGGLLTPPSTFDPTKAIVTQASAPGKNEQVIFRVDETTVNQGYFLATYDAQGNQQPPIAFVSKRTGNTQTAAFGFIYAGPTDPTIECYARITSSTATQITVTVTARGTGVQVQYVGVTGGATFQSGTAAGTPVTPNGTNNVWVFNRAAINGGAGQAQFRATKAGFQSDDDFVTIEEQGRDTVSIVCQASVVASSATAFTVRVVVMDPVSQGATTASITYVVSSNIVTAVSPTSPQTVTPTTSLVAAGSNFKDFVVPRSLFNTGTGRIVFTATMANRTADTDSVDIPSLEDTVAGTQILSNPNFFGGLTGYSVYDLPATGKVTHSLVVDATVPNPSGQFLRISVAANAQTAPAVSPGEGGFFLGIPEDGGVYKPDTYHKNALITWIIRAKIPTGYVINWASNATGNETTIAWQTPQVGTGNFFEYRVLEQIGFTGSFSTTGHFYLTPVSSYDGLAFTWDVASVAAYDRNRAASDTVIPQLNLQSNESGGTASVVASVFDPQNRIRGSGAGVRFTTISGRGTPDNILTASAPNKTATGTVIGPGGVWSTTTTPGDVYLVGNTPSYVEADLFGIDANGQQGQLLDHKRLVFGLGNVPVSPEVAYSVDGNGNLMVSLLVDNDTAFVKCVATKNAPPSSLQLSNATPVAVPAGTYTIQIGTGGPPKITLSGLNTGERYYVSAQALNTSNVASNWYTIQDVYVQGDSAVPRVTWTSTSPSSQNISFRLKPNRHCAEFEIYIKEYSTAPPNELPIDSIYPTPYNAYVVGVDLGELVYPAHPETDLDIIVPIASGGNYLLITVVPYDALARQGPKLTKSAQGSGTNPPLAPTASSVTSGPTQTTVNISVTMPATVPSRIRTYINGVLNRTDVTTGATANNPFALPQFTGLSPSTTYNFAFAGYDITNNLESVNRQGPLSVTTTAPSGGNGQIPQPLLSLANVNYDIATEVWSFTITPGSGSPAGVTWHVARFTAATPLASFVEMMSGTSTTLSFSDPMDTSTGTNYWFVVWGTLASWTDSLKSNPTTLGTEVATGSVHKTGYDEPTAIPTIVSCVGNPSGNSHMIQVTWSNTDTANPIFISYERLVSGVWQDAGYKVATAGSTTYTPPGIGVIDIGVYYRARVRYYNSHKNGTYSSYAQTASPIT
jgi:hypothetical protein